MEDDENRSCFPLLILLLLLRSTLPLTRPFFHRNIHVQSWLWKEAVSQHLPHVDPWCLITASLKKSHIPFLTHTKTNKPKLYCILILISCSSSVCSQVVFTHTEDNSLDFPLFSLILTIFFTILWSCSSLDPYRMWSLIYKSCFCCMFI